MAQINVSSKKAHTSPQQRWHWSTIGLLLLALVNVIVVCAWAVDNYTRTTPTFCKSCHIMQGHVDSYLTGNFMDSVHRRAGVGCKDCHQDYSVADEIGSLLKYATGNYERVPSRRKFDQAMCTRCHISLEYHANRTDYLTRNPHLSHWPDLRCGTCHLSHDKQVDYCARCHDNGGQRMTEGPIVPRARNPWADPNAQRPNVQ